MIIIEHLIRAASLLIISFSYVIVMESNTNDLQLMDVTNTTMLFTQILHKEYATANQIKSDDFMNYSKFEISYGNYSDYEFQQFIGKGASGNAYLGE